MGPSATIVVTPEIEAADHGLRNDGGVGGPSLAERVNLGQQLFNGGNDTTEAASLSSLTSPSSTMVSPSIYDLRNAKIAAAAAAGKSRWGKMENEKATSLASNILPSVSSSSITITSVADIPVPPEVEAADHGLRNDGGVGGPSLAERVNLGQQLFNGGNDTTEAASLSSLTSPSSTMVLPSIYDLRNAKIAAAAAA